jgi:hypothetical protein
VTTHFSAWLQHENGELSIDKETTESECGMSNVRCAGNIRLVTCGRCKRTMMYKAALTIHNMEIIKGVIEANKAKRGEE